MAAVVEATVPADAAAVANTLVRAVDNDDDEDEAAECRNDGAPNAGLPVAAAGDAGTDAKGGGVSCPAVEETVEGAEERDEADEVCDDADDDDRVDVDSGEMGGDELEVSDEDVCEKYADEEEEEEEDDGDVKERSEEYGDASWRAASARGKEKRTEIV